MSAFDDWYAAFARGTGNEWKYRNRRGMEKAFNAGMERAAQIASNVKAPFSRFTIAAAIRKEIE